MDVRMGDSIARGVAFLRSTQRTDGGFNSFSSAARQPFVSARTYDTIFTPALILNALCDIPQTEDIRSRLAVWLLAQKSPSWSFNYWSQAAQERKTQPYPDDLDDTCCALLALHRHDSSLVSADALGSAVRLLLATESAVGGPYRTWLVSPSAPAAWQDVDLAVNCNVACFVRRVAHPLPKLINYIEAAIAGSSFHSPYYPSEYPLLYYLARAYRGEQTPQLVTQLRKRRTADGHWHTPLQTALALSALDELGAADNTPQALTYLLEQQQGDGSWAAEAFCLDPAQAGQPYFSGAPALTTAFVLEALGRNLSSSAAAATSRAHVDSDRTSQQLYRQVIGEARTHFKSLGPSLRRQSLLTLKRMAKGDHNREIVLLPYFFARSLQMPPPPQQLLVRLGTANLFGWTAYTIYDDFLDAGGDPQFLSVASMAQRHSLQQFQTALPHNPEFQKAVLAIFDTIDSANAWEVAHCRFTVTGQTIIIGKLPHYGTSQQLAERSLGHALTPLGVLAAADLPPDSPQARLLLRSLKHYLIARQLHDDLHDWEADLRAGQCSYVVTAILAGLKIKPGAYSLAKLVPRMQHEFWHHTLSATGERLLRHISLARSDMTRSGLPITEPNDISLLLDKIAAAVRSILTEQANAQAFLKAYRTPRI